MVKSISCINKRDAAGTSVSSFVPQLIKVDKEVPEGKLYSDYILKKWEMKPPIYHTPQRTERSNFAIDFKTE